MSNLSENKSSISKQDRALGIMVAIGGLGAIYYFVIRQALGALRHEPGVFLSLKGVMASPIVLVLGIVYAIYGDRVTDALGNSKAHPTGLISLFIILCFAADSYLYYWLKALIEGCGYTFSF